MGVSALEKITRTDLLPIRKWEGGENLWYRAVCNLQFSWHWDWKSQPMHI